MLYIKNISAQKLLFISIIYFSGYVNTVRRPFSNRKSICAMQFVRKLLSES